MRKQNFDLPPFNNALIETLYQYDLQIPHDILREIIALPRETLMADLSTAIEDLDKNFAQYEKEINESCKRPFFEAPIHILSILQELQDPKGMELLIRFASMDEDKHDVLLNDYLTEHFWQPCYYNLENNIEACVDFLKLKGKNPFAQSAVGTALSKFAFKNPEYRSEILSKYAEVFTHFTEILTEDDENEITLLGMLTADVLDLQGVEIKDVVKAAYDKGVVDHMMTGDWKMTEKEFKSYNPPTVKLMDIFTFYDDAVSTWFYYRESSKPNRNSPCPCGSRKAYKKCHGK